MFNKSYGSCFLKFIYYENATKFDQISILVLKLLSTVKFLWPSQKTLTLDTLLVAPIVPTLMDARVNCLYYVDLPPIYNLTDVNNQFQLVLRK